MADSSELNEEFDQELDQLLPDSISLEDPPEEPRSDSADSPTTWQQRVSNWHPSHGVTAERQLELANREIDRYCEALDLPKSVKQMAEQTFKQYTATTDEFLIELVVAGIVYSSAKLNEYPITPEDIVRTSNEMVTRKILLRTSKEIVSELGLDPTAFFDASMYVGRFCEELNLVPAVGPRAKQILDYCNEAEITSGKSPTGLAAAAIYNACREQDYDITQSEISDVAEVSELTIRNRYQEQREVVNEIERPEDDVTKVVEWAIDRIKLQPEVRSEIRFVLDFVDESKELVHESEEIDDEPDEKPLRWGMAIVMVGARRADYDLNYSTLKALSGVKTDDIRSNVSLLQAVTPPS
ncbi:transcription initiation factor IIB family protein [Halolamina salina]|uniref:Cyclin-like domain-containing protein n=1 Tax=Halolamina salina TaxID=1220023 RepID=A0ABD6BB92_9EURY